MPLKTALVAALASLAALGGSAPGVDARLREGECEVCIKSVEQFAADVSAAGLKDMEQIEDQLVKSCKKLKHPKEKRFCYYIGGSKDSATRMLRELARPLSFNMPPVKICEKLKKRDHAICELAYPQAIDLDAMDLKKQRVKVLKNILSEWGESCNGCTAKQDYLDRINEVRHLHAPQKDEL